MGKLTYYEKTTRFQDKLADAIILACLLSGDSGLCCGGEIAGYGGETGFYGSSAIPSSFFLQTDQTCIVGGDCIY